MKQALLVIAGAAIGGTVGFYLFQWVYDQGFYGLVIPGGLLGIGAGFARSRSLVLAVVCGLAAVMLGLFTEWTIGPFRVDKSFTYFLLHVHQLKPLTQAMVALGGFVGFWVPYRRHEPQQKEGSK